MSPSQGFVASRYAAQVRVDRVRGVGRGPGAGGVFRGAANPWARSASGRGGVERLVGPRLDGAGRRWWWKLRRDTVWAQVVAEVQRRVAGLTGADLVVLWLKLPPEGQWLRLSEQLPFEAVLPPEQGPYPFPDEATFVAEGMPRRLETRDVTGAYRTVLEAAGVTSGWLLPLTAPAPLAGEANWWAVLGLGWKEEAPQVLSDLSPLQPALWHVLRQRVESAFTEAVVDGARGMGPPLSNAEWAGRLMALREALGGDTWTLYRIEPVGDGTYRVLAVADLGALAGHGARLAEALTENPAHQAASHLLRAAREGHTVFVDDFDTVGTGVHALPTREGRRSALLLPLGHDDVGRSGVLVIYWPAPRGWRSTGLSMQPWDALRRVAAEWWEHADALRDATHDPLTGLPNRRGLAHAWEERARRVAAGTLAVIDADHFSDVNDRWGHLTGDAVLRTLAQVLDEAVTAAGGFAARWGGDEFVLWMPEVVDWASWGPRLKAAFDRALVRAQVPFTVGLSGGAVTWRGEAPAFDAAFAEADSKLLQAKRAGRGRFVA